MISIKQNNIYLDSMGLFTANHIWKRENIVDTLCELLFVIDGELSIQDNMSDYVLNKGNMLVLEPGTNKRKYSCLPKTLFYWIKFYSDNPSELIGDNNFFYEVKDNYLFKEMHHNNYVHKDTPEVAELILAQIILHNKLATVDVKTKKVVADAYEMIRLNASAKLRATDIASTYGYNINHLSRIIKKEYGKGIKALIDEFIVKRAKNYLVNSNHSVKEISGLLKFDNENSFVKFYKYHENQTPTQYRNEFSTTRIKEPEIIN